MKISGSNVIAQPVDKVWDALLDPRVLVATIPGCERLETTGEHQYAMTVTAGVAAIKGTYSGSCALSELKEHGSLTMRLQGAGSPGTVDATVDVTFDDLGAEGTRVSYEADAVVGGMVGGVGQRMLSSVSKRMAGEFFSNVGQAISAPPSGAPALTRRSRHEPTPARRARSSPRRPRPAASRRRTTSSRASWSAPGWCCSVSSPVRSSGVGGDRSPGRGFPGSPGNLPLVGPLQRLTRARLASTSTPVVRVAELSVDSTARDQAAAVRRREISARELLDLHLARIAERNPELNAVVSLDEERAREGAAAADQALATDANAEVGPLHGLPFAFKDTHDVAGWRTTYGSPLFADHVPETDDLLVERVRAAGVVVIGKTNVPEFAAGSHTFNKVFGTTLNPVDPSRSAGGSSGGAACALAAGMVPLADGSDMGGSLRNPASFCGVVGLRPSLGRVPSWPTDNLWETTATGGPLARNVGDLALLLSVMAGPDPRVPTALGDPGDWFAPPVSGTLTGLRIALSVDLGGAFEVDHEVAEVVASSAAVLEGAGATVSSAYPTLTEAEDTFRTLRAWLFQAGFGPLLAEHPDEFKESLADNIRAGEHLTGADVARAYAQRTNLSEQMREFFTTHDLLVLPVSQVPPFPADQEFPTEINGRPMETYLDWMRACYLITVTGCPAISVPYGRTRDGLPIGLQLVAAHGADRFLLEAAAALEATLESGQESQWT